MKNSLKKGIVAVALASSMVIPAAVSATADYLNGGHGSYEPTLHYAWGIMNIIQ